jgi:Asp-tRNA(Asn)/Glu-tRNA(Gln) amidotransferase B subunit
MEYRKKANFIINFYKGACKKAKVDIYNDKVNPEDVSYLLWLEENELLTRKQIKDIIIRRLNS